MNADIITFLMGFLKVKKSHELVTGERLNPEYQEMFENEVQKLSLPT